MDVVASGDDYSADPRFREAKPGKPYFSPVYFRKESEPYMRISMVGSGKGAGVTVAEVNLKFIWDVVSQIKIGKAGHAYVVDSQGHLIAHPDISLVLKKTDLSTLAQVKGALGAAARGAGMPSISRDLDDRQVLSASAPIAPLGWAVLIEQPLVEAFEPIRASIFRTVGLVLLGILLSVIVSLVLARRMVRPIQALTEGVGRIGAGDLAYQLDVRTGDESEARAEGRRAHPRVDRVPRATDCDERDPPRHQQLPDRPAAGAGRYRRKRRESLQCQGCRAVPSQGGHAAGRCPVRNYFDEGR
jgi:sensor histidine kinase YesM